MLPAATLNVKAITSLFLQKLKYAMTRKYDVVCATVNKNSKTGECQ